MSIIKKNEQINDNHTVNMIRCRHRLFSNWQIREIKMITDKSGTDMVNRNNSFETYEGREFMLKGLMEV